MDIERKLLLNLALRLRWAKQHLRRVSPQADKGYFIGCWTEANNSFQAAKQIYFESLK